LKSQSSVCLIQAIGIVRLSSTRGVGFVAAFDGDSEVPQITVLEGLEFVLRRIRGSRNEVVGGRKSRVESQELWFLLVSFLSFRSRLSFAGQPLRLCLGVTGCGSTRGVIRVVFELLGPCSFANDEVGVPSSRQ
jgi:hypothetical protein